MGTTKRLNKTVFLLILSILIFVSLQSFSSIASPQTNYKTGLLFDDKRYQSVPLAEPVYNGVLPASYDLSEDFPTPGDQGSQGSCVGWAVSYALKSFQEKVERRWPFNNEHTFSPSYVYNQIKKGQGCQGGAYIEDALDLLQERGAVPLNMFEYDEYKCFRQPTAVERQIASSYKVATWRRVNPQSLNEVKDQIAAGFPVVIGMMVGQEFMQLHGRTVYSRKNSSNEMGGHAMVIVGYNDNLKAFRVINSWSTKWADNGFGWISYDTFKNDVRTAFCVQDIVSPNPKPEPKPSFNWPLWLQGCWSTTLPNGKYYIWHITADGNNVVGQPWSDKEYDHLTTWKVEAINEFSFRITSSDGITTTQLTYQKVGNRSFQLVSRVDPGSGFIQTIWSRSDCQGKFNTP